MLGPIDTIFMTGLVVATVLSLILRWQAGPRNGGPLRAMMALWPGWFISGASLDIVPAPASFYVFPAITAATAAYALHLRRNAPAAWNRLLLSVLFVEGSCHVLFWVWATFDEPILPAGPVYWAYQFALNVCFALALCIVSSSGAGYAWTRFIDLVLPDPSSGRYAWPRHPRQGKRYSSRGLRNHPAQRAARRAAGALD